MQVGTDFVHVILTRFNLATPGRESTIRNQPGWLGERFDLFEKYCLPTMAAQTARGFQWVIYFDKDTPEPFRSRIEACRQICDFHPYFTPMFPGEHWPVSVREVLAEKQLPETPWLLTTRLDNDDGLAADFVARVQAAVTSQPPARGSFNVTNGYVFDGRRTYALAHPSNAFASLLERFDESARTISSIQHMHLAEEGPITQVGGPGAWLQVVHGGNVSNKIRGRRVPAAELEGRFPASIGLGADKASSLAIAAENLVLAPLREARDRAADLVRSLRRRG